MELNKRGAELLFHVLTEREEKASVAIATNESFSGWNKTFTDPRLCAAIVDRLTYNGTIIETGTDSYRLAHTRPTNRQLGLTPEGVLRLSVRREEPDLHDLSITDREEIDAGHVHRCIRALAGELHRHSGEFAIRHRRPGDGELEGSLACLHHPAEQRPHTVDSPVFAGEAVRAWLVPDDVGAEQCHCRGDIALAEGVEV